MWPHCDNDAIFAEKEGGIATIFFESELNCKLLIRLAVWLVDLLLFLFSPITPRMSSMLFLLKIKHPTWSFLDHSRLLQFIVYIVQNYIALNLLSKLFSMQSPPPPTLYHNTRNKCFLNV